MFAIEALAESRNRGRATLCADVLGRIVALCDSAQEFLSLRARLVGREHAVTADLDAAGATATAILREIGLLTAR